LADFPPANAAIWAAASVGRGGALEAAAVAAVIDEDEDLVALCEARVQKAVETPTIETREEDGREVHSVSLDPGFELTALLARFVGAELRSRFATKLALEANEDRLPIPSRASAVNGLFNLAGRLGAVERCELAAQIRPLIDGEIAASRWEGEPPGAFERFQINVGRREDLRAAALSAWARLRDQDQTEWTEEDRILLEAACVDTSPALAASAYEAFSGIAAVPFPAFAVAGLAHSDARVRSAAARAWLYRTGSLPSEPILTSLLEDESLSVRLALVWSTRELAEDARTELLTRLGSDRDAYVRALAQRQLKGDSLD
jgi:hypothetical protein